jgi:hypothetical protein
MVDLLLWEFCHAFFKVGKMGLEEVVHGLLVFFILNRKCCQLNPHHYISPGEHRFLFEENVCKD